MPKPTLTAKKSRANQYAGINEEELEEIPAEESGILNETDQEWTQFDMMELEEARSKKKDPKSFSTIFCFG